MRGLWSIVLGCWLKRQGLANLESDLSQKGRFPQEHYPSESQLMPILRIQPLLCPFCLLESCGPVITQWTAAAKSLQSCPTLCDPIDGSPPGSDVPGILQARTLEWVAISFSNAWKWKVKVKSISCAQLLATHGLQPTRLLYPWDFPGKSTGVGCHCFLRLQDDVFTKQKLFLKGFTSGSKISRAFKLWIWITNSGSSLWKPK